MHRPDTPTHPYSPFTPPHASALHIPPRTTPYLASPTKHTRQIHTQALLVESVMHFICNNFTYLARVERKLV
ncbi:hypothetical protein E2C01_059077 [Portunus trituberculatus]|uniref:Uncharacterized protein n=1 Tax=Portunus trituberculatus TaxID=210409 RepID=A0A5B7H5V0_PORTR|nr:hypothetical protein [Portunus trituberculatus]